MRIKRLRETPSTHDEVKRYLPDGREVIVCAKKQTKGRGTKGRSFLSNEGGIYLSHLKFYRDVPAKNTFQVMMNAAVAVCRTVEAFNLSPSVKWPNDILVGGKKICGILIETVLSGEFLHASIVGIGLNVCNGLDELSTVATSICEQTGKRISVAKVENILVKNLKKVYSAQEYAGYLHFLGKEVTVVEGECSYVALAKEVTSDGRLVVRTGEGEKTLSAAEISLRV